MTRIWIEKEKYDEHCDLMRHVLSYLELDAKMHKTMAISSTKWARRIEESLEYFTKCDNGKAKRANR